MQELPIDNDSWVQAIRSLWLRRGLKLESGASMPDIESTELQVGLRFPSDMKDLYRMVNGFKDWDMDVDSMISIWPIERIREEYNASTDENFVGFCDYLINSHCIGFFKDRNGIYKNYDEFNPVADSFKEVIDLINNHADIMF